MANIERIKAKFAEWQKKNPDKRRITEAKRRAQKQGSPGSYTEQDIAELLIRQRDRCGYCDKSLKRGFHVDHVIPLVLGGTNNRANLQLLCASCNTRKGKKHPLDYAKTLGLLV